MWPGPGSGLRLGDHQRWGRAVPGRAAGDAAAGSPQPAVAGGPVPGRGDCSPCGLPAPASRPLPCPANKAPARGMAAAPGLRLVSLGGHCHMGLGDTGDALLAAPLPLMWALEGAEVQLNSRCLAGGGRQLGASWCIFLGFQQPIPRGLSAPRADGSCPKTCFSAAAAGHSQGWPGGLVRGGAWAGGGGLGSCPPHPIALAVSPRSSIVLIPCGNIPGTRTGGDPSPAGSTRSSCRRNPRPPPGD